jgi:hypothetical protein
MLKRDLSALPTVPQALAKGSITAASADTPVTTDVNIMIYGDEIQLGTQAGGKKKGSERLRTVEKFPRPVR